MYLYRITTNILTTICNSRSRNFQGTNNCTYWPPWRLAWRWLCIDPKHVARNTTSTSNKLRVVYDCIILHYISWPRWCVLGDSGGVFLRNLIFILDGCRRSALRIGRYRRERVHGMVWYALCKRLSRSQKRTERGDIEENLIMPVIDVLLCNQ